MLRTVLALGSFAVFLAAAGCNMCCHQYDSSGPVFSDGGCQSAHSRAGSILGGGPQPSMSPKNNQLQDGSVSPSPTPAQAKKQNPSVSFGMAGGRVQGPALGKAQPGDVPGSERIVSVTDRVVKPSTDSSQAAQESSPEAGSSQPLPATGWTARRPTTEVLR